MPSKKAMQLAVEIAKHQIPDMAGGYLAKVANLIDAHTAEALAEALKNDADLTTVYMVGYSKGKEALADYKRVLGECEHILKTVEPKLFTVYKFANQYDPSDWEQEVEGLGLWVEGILAEIAELKKDNG